MATLRQAIDFAKQNPEDARSVQLMENIKSGSMDDIARQEGIDLTGKSSTFELDTEDESFLERASGNIQERAGTIVEAIEGEGEFKGKSALARGTGATAEAFGAISSTAYEALPEPARNVLDTVADKIGVGVGKVIDSLSKTDLIEGAAQGDTSKLEEFLGVIEDLGVISGEALGPSELATNLTGTARLGQKAVREGAKQAKKATAKAKSGVKSIGEKTGISEAIPTRERLVEFQTTRALDLTQGDVKNISKSTGNEVGDWLAENNLIGKNKEATEKTVREFGNEAYKQVREEIAKVPKTYKQGEIPRYKDSLTEVLSTVEGKAGLEDTLNEVQTLLGKKQLSLSDAQRAKELIDENFKLFKVTGDKSESAAKEGIRNIRKELREFIESEVKDAGGPDINKLNNNVATARGITEAIAERSTRGLTRSSIGLGDLGTFGVGSTFGGPLTGIAAVAGKKILESSAVRLRFAKWLDSLNDARKAQVAKELTEGRVPEDMAKAIDFEFKPGDLTEEVE